MSQEIGAVFSIKDEFSGKVDGIIGKAGKAEGAIGETGGAFSKMGGFAKKGAKVAAVGLAAMASAGVATFAAVNNMVGGFDDIAKTAPKLGISTDALQEMDYWAGQNGISSEDAEKAIGRLNQRIGEAKAGNEKYSDVLQTLGVDMGSLEDGTLSTEDAMATSIQSLSEMTNEQDKAALASELFGKKLGRELMPALQDGSLSIEEAKEKAEELGIVIDGDTLEAAEVFADTWDDLTRSMGAFGKNIMADLMPAFQTMMDWLLDNMPMIKEKVGNAVEATWEIIKKVYERIKPGLEWLKDEGFPMLMNAAEFAFDAIASAIEFLFPIIESVFEFLQPAFEWMSEVGLPAIVNAFEFAIEKVQEFFTFIQEFGERFPEMQETISTVLENVRTIFEGAVDGVIAIWGLLQPVFEVTWEVIKSLFVSGASFIADMMESITQVFSGIIDFISGVFTGNWEQAWQGVIDIFGGIFGGLVGIAKGPINAVIALVNGLINGMNKFAVPDWVPLVGGKGINIPTIPALAKGTSSWSGGMAQVHEKGGEIIDLPNKSRVYPHDKSVAMAREQGRNETVNKGTSVTVTGNTFNVRKESDIDKIASALVNKLQGANINMA